ncbi:type VI secretion system baseplate subunit TssF [Pseudomonas idahonensis]|uniref:type VI secretion system baseplate subunit TssF n=1 Tax=Pseudomonas idahonensis TaxID=2942628 RepID=UPI0030CD014C
MPLKDSFLKEMDSLRRFGRTLVARNPALAPFLSTRGVDKDVERLIEGFSFLAARLHLTLDAPLPELTHPLLQRIWPHYLRPFPSTTLVRFNPVEGALDQRHIIPKGTRLMSRPIRDVQCEFRTCKDLILYPLRIDQVRETHSHDHSLLHIGLGPNGKLSLGDFNCDQLEFQFTGDKATALQVYLWLARYLSEIRVEFNGRATSVTAQHVEFPGFAPDDALLPAPDASLDGYRILQDYFTFPERFLCFRLINLKNLWPAEQTEQVRFEFRFNRPMPTDLHLNIDDLALYCVPAINLFQHDAIPLALGELDREQLVQPADLPEAACEIFSIDQAQGMQREHDAEDDMPVYLFHAFHDISRDEKRDKVDLYYQERIESDLVSQQALHYVAFVHGDGRPYHAETEIASLTLTCTNNNLPAALGIGDICLPTSETPVIANFSNITAPTPTYRPVLDGQQQWQLISNFALNQQSLADSAPMREVLEAYDLCSGHNIEHARQLKGRLHSIGPVNTQTIDRLIRGNPVRGYKTVLHIDPTGFAGDGDLFLFATVLSHFFAMYASKHSFHLLKVINSRSKEAYEWPMRTGKQPTL